MSNLSVVYTITPPHAPSIHSNKGGANTTDHGVDTSTLHAMDATNRSVAYAGMDATYITNGNSTKWKKK